MTLTALATSFFLVSLGQASAGDLACTFPTRLDLAFVVNGKRQFPKVTGKEKVCHGVSRDAWLQLHGDRGTVAVRESGKRLPKGAKLIACEESFQVLRVGRPHPYASCPGGETGVLYEARIRADHSSLPEGRLSVAFCGSEIVEVNVDLGEQWTTCKFAWRVDEPIAEFLACAERLPPTPTRRSVSGTQRLPCDG
jgi:hypothetical protein